MLQNKLHYKLRYYKTEELNNLNYRQKITYKSLNRFLNTMTAKLIKEYHGEVW